MKKIAVIGGGASGLMAAITASEDKNTIVTIYESKDCLGKKILKTGNGKCNYSNTNISNQMYSGSGKMQIEKFLKIFGVKETMDFFYQLGMLTEDKNGYLYPYSGQAVTVFDLLLNKIQNNKVSIIVDTKIKSIKMKDKKFVVCTNNKAFEYDKVIVSTGLQAGEQKKYERDSIELLKSLEKYGHNIIKPLPSLVQLITKENSLKEANGVRALAELKLYIDGKFQQLEKGELQITDYGISGIVTFQLAGNVARALDELKNVTINIDFVPDYNREQWHKLWNHRIEAHKKYPQETSEDFLDGICNKKLNRCILKSAGVDSHKEIKKLDSVFMNRMEDLFKNFPINIEATKGSENAQVMSGGIPFNEITNSLESKYCKGLFFSGEALDIDGCCGGYNLQWAWTSGYIAGKAAANDKN